MRKLLLCALLVASAVPIASADSIMIQSAGATTVTVSGGGPYSNSNFNGWIIFLIAGASSSPGGGIIWPRLGCSCSLLKRKLFDQSFECFL